MEALPFVLWRISFPLVGLLERRWLNERQELPHPGHPIRVAANLIEMLIWLVVGYLLWSKL